MEGKSTMRIVMPGEQLRLDIVAPEGNTPILTLTIRRILFGDIQIEVDGRGREAILLHRGDPRQPIGIELIGPEPVGAKP